MKIALFDIKGDDNRNVISNISMNIRNMVTLAGYLNADFYYNTEQLKKQKNYDVIVFGFGSISTEINKTFNYIKNMAQIPKLWYLVGDIEQSTNPALFYICKRLNTTYNVIQAFEASYKNYGKYNNQIYYININLLVVTPPNENLIKKYDCIYYGRWRKNREKYFKKYLQKTIYLSTSSKNFKKYKHIGCDPIYIDKLNWHKKKQTLNLFRYSLYFEDEISHKVYTSLANRWYEAGICNNVVFFDSNCLHTIQKSEISKYINDIYFYIVHSHQELLEKINICNQNFETHLKLQQQWRKNELKLKKENLNTIEKLLCDNKL